MTEPLPSETSPAPDVEVLPPRARRIVGGTAAGGTIGGALIGVLATAGKDDVAAAVRWVFSELQGPFGIAVFATVAFAGLAWYHVWRIGRLDETVAAKSENTRRVAADKDAIIAELRIDLREAHLDRVTDLSRIRDEYQRALVASVVDNARGQES